MCRAAGGGPCRTDRYFGRDECAATDTGACHDHPSARNRNYRVDRHRSACDRHVSTDRDQTGRNLHDGTNGNRSTRRVYFSPHRGGPGDYSQWIIGEGGYGQDHAAR